MNKFESIRVTTGKLIIIKLIRALFIHLPQLVGTHLAHCVYPITRMSQTIFRKYLHRMNKTTKICSAPGKFLLFARFTVLP